MIQEYVIREEDSVWEVRLGDRLLGEQPTKIDAYRAAEALALAAAARGQHSKVVIGGLEFPIKAAEALFPPTEAPTSS